VTKGSVRMARSLDHPLCPGKETAGGAPGVGVVY